MQCPFHAHRIHIEIDEGRYPQGLRPDMKEGNDLTCRRRLLGCFWRLPFGAIHPTL